LAENFLPKHYQRWGKDLKYIQDLLGEVHDLDVLAATTRQTRACTSRQEAQLWHAAIVRERLKRVQAYREKMAGRRSLWPGWSQELPAGEALRQAILVRFEAWTESLDPDPAHTRAVIASSLQLYDSLRSSQLLPAAEPGRVSSRDLLYVAALAHEVGRHDGGQKHHKRSRRMLQGLQLPPGWSEKDLAMAGLIVRYHRGALPATQKFYTALSGEERHTVDCLAGILRLADSLAAVGGITIHPIENGTRDHVIEVLAEDYRPRSRQAQRIATERHLLEDACAVAVILRTKGHTYNHEVEGKMDSNRSADIPGSGAHRHSTHPPRIPATGQGGSQDKPHAQTGPGRRTGAADRSHPGSAGLQP